jgi:sulfide dehydrogenase [flavocytochrome c] flavoprotein subunit
MQNSRRKFIQHTLFGSYLGAHGGILFAESPSVVHSPSLKKAKIVIVGAGFGGAATAKYLKIFSGGQIDVTLIDPSPNLVSCPLSNLVINGQMQISEITKSRDPLRQKYGIKLIQDTVERILPEVKKILLQQGITVPYDKLILSPGIDMIWDSLPKMKDSVLQNRFVHAMKAGSQTLTLRKQLESMKDGEVFAISIPLAPYRCPPSPYERAGQVANYFKKYKPRSKILVLDANAEITSKSTLFKKAWSNYYPNMIEYRNNHTLVDVDPSENALLFEVQDDVKASVLNVIPPMRAGDIAFRSNLANINQRWCEVDFLTYESKVIPDIHILGDAIQSSTQTPKSAQVANGQAKICASAIYQQLADLPINKNPTFSSICYSVLGEKTGAHISTMHYFDPKMQSMAVVSGSNSISTTDNAQEYSSAIKWANNIWSDTLI